MEVIIDGVKYVSENDVGVTVRGVTYSSVAHWLFNIQADLINKWINTAEDGKAPATDIDEYKRITEFQKFSEEYLGFKDMKEGCGYVECKPKY